MVPNGARTKSPGVTPFADEGDGVPARILDGKAVAAELRAGLLTRILALRERGTHPKLAVILVGEDEASTAYVHTLERTGARMGVDVGIEHLPPSASVAQIRERLAALDDDATVHGVMLQQPLPEHLSIRAIADAIPQRKDVDGANPANQGNLAFGTSTRFVPATPAAVMLLLERSPHWPLRGRTAAVIGRSVVVGAPVALLMLVEDATVTVLHKASRSLQPYVRMADVVVTATGVPGLLRADDVAPGATVIDVGTTLVNGALVGDADFARVAQVAGAITPVPGGVGPVTNVALLRNVVVAAERMTGSL